MYLQVRQDLDMFEAGQYSTTAIRESPESSGVNEMKKGIDHESTHLQKVDSTL